MNYQYFNSFECFIKYHIYFSITNQNSKKLNFVLEVLLRDIPKFIKPLSVKFGLLYNYL